MKDDPIISRIRSIRHQISEHYHHNPYELIMHYIELEQQHPERFANILEEERTKNLIFHNIAGQGNEYHPVHTHSRTKSGDT